MQVVGGGASAQQAQGTTAEEAGRGGQPDRDFKHKGSGARREGGLESEEGIDESARA